MKLSDITDKIGAFVRARPIVTGLIIIVVAGGLTYFYIANYQAQLSKSSATGPFQQNPVPGGGTGGTGGAGGTTPTPTPLTNTGSVAAGGACTPVTPPGWNWTQPTPAGQTSPWCTPFPPTAGLTSGQTTFPDCFSWDLSLSTGQHNWADMNAIGNPLNSVLQALPQTILKADGNTFNNCPWTVHLITIALGSRQAYNGSNEGSADQNVDRAFTVSPDSRDFPSCWNNSSKPTCPSTFKDEYKLTTYNCGFVTATAAWRHYISGTGGGSSSGNKDNGGWHSVFTYGRDCTTADVAAGLAPGTAASSGTPTPSALPSPAVLSVQCTAGKLPIVLNWSQVSNATENVLVRRTNGANPQNLVAQVTPPFNTFIFSDSNLTSGNTYSYQVKTDPNVVSNSVTVTIDAGGNCTTSSTSPSPSLSVSPTPIITATFSPSSTPVVTITPPLAGNQLQCGPSSQTVAVGQEAVVQAFGGTGIYAFAVSENGMMRQINTTQIGATYSTPGGKSILLSDGQNAVQCSVNVVGLAVGATPTPTVIVGGPGVGTVGGVQTGPGETTLLAVIISTIVSLLYVSYTHSPLGRRHEAEDLSKDQNPLDFRK